MEETCPEEGESLPSADEVWCSRWEHCRAGFDATGNPIFIWKLLVLREVEADTARIFEGDPDMPLSEMRKLPLKRHPLPDWVEGWLGAMAGQVMQLAGRRDGRTRPAPSDIDDPVKRKAFSDWYRTPTLNAAQTAGLVPLVMGFTREAGWNAFAHYRTAEASRMAAEAIWMLTEEFPGAVLPPRMKKGEARNRIMEEYGFVDERAFRRFLDKGKRAFPPPKD